MLSRIIASLWWRFTTPDQVTHSNVDHIVRHYGPPPKWWLEKHRSWIEENGPIPTPLTLEQIKAMNRYVEDTSRGEKEP